MLIKQIHKLKNTIKPIITAVATLTLCCSSLSYAHEDHIKDKAAISYPLDNEMEAIEFDRAILKDSPYFATNLALIAFSKNLYHALHRTLNTLGFQSRAIPYRV